MTSQPLTPLSTTRMSLRASTVNTSKEKTHISKRKNDVLAARSKKKPRAAKKGVRRGTTSSQVDPRKDEFVDSWDEQINFKKYKEVQETFWRDCIDAYCFGLIDTKFVSIDQCFCSEDGSINVRALEQHIVLGMENWLAKIGDINQRQKNCLIP